MTALRTVPWLDTQTEWFWVNVVAVIVAGLVWTGLVSRRGPLEAVLTAAVRAVQRSVLGDGLDPSGGQTPADDRSPPDCQNPPDGARVSGPRRPQPPPSA